MTSLYAQFTTSPDLEKEGIVLEYGFNSKGLPIGIRVARAGGSNAQYSKRMEIKVKPFRRQIQTESIDKKLLEKLIMEVFCETVVLGWENVEDREGNPLPFSYEAAVKLFTDLPDLFADVQDAAQKASLFRAEILEGVAGN